MISRFAAERFALVSCLLLLAGLAASARGQTRTLRIVTYNIEADITVSNAQPAFTNLVQNPGPPLPGLVAPATNGAAVSAGGVLEGIGEELLNGNAQPPDILALEETTSNPSTVAPIVSGLNTFYGISGLYSYSSYQAVESGNSPGSGNGPNAIVFNTRTVQLVASHPVDPAGGTSKLGSSSGEYREVMRYEFAPAGVTPSATNEFYLYVSHYKAGTGSSNEAKRLGEAEIIRTNEAIDLPAAARVLYVGDYNVDNSGEAGYQTILAAASPNGAAQGQGIDPLNAAGSPNIDWSSSTTDTNILAMLTEHAYGLEYRDDLQLMTTNVFAGLAGGLAYVPGTFHAFGNNGTTPYGGTVNSSANSALAGRTRLVTNGPVFISAAQLEVDLTGASDHLPVVADYTIPLPASAVTAVAVSGANLVLTAANGVTNAPFTVLASANLLTPVTNWTVAATGTVPGGGFAITLTNAAGQQPAQAFYLLEEK